MNQIIEKKLYCLIADRHDNILQLLYYPTKRWTCQLKQLDNASYLK